MKIHLGERRRGSKSLVALTTCLFLAASACASNNEATGDNNDSASDDTLRIIIQSDPDGMNLMKSSAGVTINQIGRNVGDTLAYQDVENDQILPWLATSWSQVDDLTWEVTLREGVKFHNGEEMTAQDAAASVTYAATPPDTFLWDTYYSIVTGAKATGDYTFEIMTSEPDPVLHKRLPFMYVLPEETLDDEFLAKEVVATGPYEFVSWQRGQNVVIKRFDDYWGDEKPEFETVEFLIRPDPGVGADALRAGEADIVTQLTAEDAQDVPQLIRIPGPEVAGFKLNVPGQKDGSIMEDVRVRQAVNHAVNREEVIESLYGGFATLPQGQFASQAMSGTDPSLQDYEYDPDKARELLKEAGVEGATVTIGNAVGLFPKGEELTEVMAGYLSEVGLKPKIISNTATQWIDQHRLHAEGGPASDLFLLSASNPFYDSTMKSLGSILSGIFLVRDPEIQKLGTDALSEPDQDRRNELSQSIWRIIHDEAYMVAVVVPDSLYGVADGLDVHITPEESLYVTQIHRTN